MRVACRKMQNSRQTEPNQAEPSRTEPVNSIINQRIQDMGPGTPHVKKGWENAGMRVRFFISIYEQRRKDMTRRQTTQINCIKILWVR